MFIKKKKSFPSINLYLGSICTPWAQNEMHCTNETNVSDETSEMKRKTIKNNQNMVIIFYKGTVTFSRSFKHKN